MDSGAGRYSPQIGRVLAPSKNTSATFATALTEFDETIWMAGVVINYNEVDLLHQSFLSQDCLNGFTESFLSCEGTYFIECGRIAIFNDATVNVG